MSYKTVWNARCKSGLLFPRMVRLASVRALGITIAVDRQEEQACNRMTARGELVCSECASATVVLTESTQGALSTWALSEVQA